MLGEEVIYTWENKKAPEKNQGLSFKTLIW